MGDYTGSIEVERPAQEVFAFLSDIRNMPRYMPTVSHVGPQGADKVAVEGESHGHHYHDEGWMRADEGARRMEWGSDSRADYGGILEVKETPAGTEVVLHLRVVPEGQAAARMQQEHGHVDHAMRIALERTLGQIKAAIETGSGAAAGGDEPRSADDLPDSRPFGSSATLNPDI